MAKGKTNLNGGGARVLNIRTSPPPTPSKGRGVDGRMQFPPGWGGLPALFAQTSEDNLTTGTLGIATNQVLLKTLEWTNTTPRPQIARIEGTIGAYFKYSGSPVVNGITPYLMVDGAAVTGGTSEPFDPATSVRTAVKVFFVTVQPGQKITAGLAASVSVISGSGAFSFVNNKLAIVAWAA